jgi:hypothetical protein
MPELMKLFLAALDLLRFWLTASILYYTTVLVLTCYTLVPALDP